MRLIGLLPCLLSLSAGAGNLLGAGSGFETGPANGMNVFAAYAWNEGYTLPGTPPEFDGTVAYEGKYSLRITADDLKEKEGRFEHNGVRFAPVKLDASSPYTLSLWARADRESAPLRLGVAELLGPGDYKTLRISKEWKRYTFTFTPEQFKLLNYRNVSVNSFGAEAGTRFWIDAVQLEKGGQATPYQAEALEFSAEIEQEFKLFTPDELKQGSACLRFRNNTAENHEFTVAYEIRNYRETLVASGELRQTAAPGANASVQLPLPPELPPGYYRIRFAAGALQDEAIFGVYREMRQKGLLPTDWPLGCDESELPAIVRKLGFGWSRNWDFTFRRICPEEGKFNFAQTDRLVETAAKNGIRLMPILGKSLYEYHTPAYDSIPDWAVERKVASSVKNFKYQVKFPRLDAWGEYVRAVVGRYPGITAWEVMNEPNCWTSPAEYFPYLKSAYEAAKAANPAALVVGGCATSDWRGEPAPWTSELLALGGYRYMDVLSLHMYAKVPPETYKGLGTDKMMQHLRDRLASHGRNLPVWHTEKSYCPDDSGYSEAKHRVPADYFTGRNAGKNHVAPDFKTKAEWLIRQTLMDSTVGKGPFFWFGGMPGRVLIMPRVYPGAYHHVEYDNSPTPELLAANGLARMLEGRNTPRELLKSGDILAAFFDGPDGALAAIWGASATAIRLPEGAELFDFFGNPVPGKNEITPGTAVQYLRFDRMTANEAGQLLRLP